MGVHKMPFELTALHGYFDRLLPPVLTVQPGDTVVYQTLDAGWDRAARECGEPLPPFDIPADPDRGHALAGPVYVDGAEPGDALEIEIQTIRPAHWGWTWAGPRPWLDSVGVSIPGETGIHWKIDAEPGIARAVNGPAISVRLQPFMGVMGNAPAEVGRHSTTPPRPVGGNLDCRELVAGSTLLLPVEVPGALFSTGDGHAAQGDGEAGQTALECPMERVELRFWLRKGLALPGPQARTPAGYLTMGFGDTLDKATGMALDAMLGHLERAFGLPRPEALAVASLVVDLRITQVANGAVGVHAVLPPDVLEVARQDGSSR